MGNSASTMIDMNTLKSWFFGHFSVWSVMVESPATLFRVTVTMMAMYAAYRWYVERFRTRVIPPSPYLAMQSRIIDKSNFVRGTILTDEFHVDPSLVTYYDLFRRGLGSSRNQPCLGRRKTFDDPITWWTYDEVDKQIRALGSAMEHLCGTNNDNHCIVGIYGRNSPEWVITMFSCSAYSFVALPLYETLGPEAMHHVCQQAPPVAVVCDNIGLADNILQWTHGSLDLLILIENSEEELEEYRNTKSARTNIISFSKLLEIGRQHLVQIKTPNPDDLYMIGYTSGSTGIPKGVMFTHKNCVLATYVGMHIIHTSHLAVDQMVHLCYLPLAHCYERINLGTFVYFGGRIGFMTSDVKGLLDDLKDYKPCYFTTVPRILIRIHSQVMQRISHSKLLLRLFQWAVDQKLAEQSRGIYRQAGLLDRLFFKPIRDKTGGCVQVLVSASAPISDEVLNFTRAAFSCPVFECYGLTETSGVLSVTLIGDMKPGHIGTPFLDFELKLIDVPEMNFIVKRDGIGEICARGQACTSAYYKDKERTADLFEPNGFLRTGDIGTWTEEGSLKVIDRLKSFFKLAHGEFVSPKKVEEIYSSSTLITNVFVDGDSHNFFLVAIIEPNFEELRQRVTPFKNGSINGHAKTNSSSSLSSAQTKDEVADEEAENEKMCRDPSVRDLILRELTQLGRQGGLRGFEQVKVLHLTHVPFTVANGLLTPTMKVTRPNVRKQYAPVLKQLYAQYRE